METSIIRLLKLPRYLLVICGLIGLGGALFIGRAALAKQMNDWQLLPQPQRFTELYFSDNRNLPATASSDATQNLSFTIHNFEHQSTVYHYKVIAMAASNDVEHSLYENTISLNHGQSKTIDQTVALPVIGKRVAVKVALQYQGITFGARKLSTQTQSIQYWLNITDSTEGN